MIDTEVGLFSVWVLGLSVGLTTCTAVCLPYLGTWAIGQGQGGRSSAIDTGAFALGKISAYALLGAMAGAIFTGGIWYALGLNDKYILAGALIGMVAGGMISFIVFRIAVILFTSTGGGALVLTGGLALLYRYGSSKAELEHLVTNIRWVLPVALMVPMLFGLIAQHKFVKGSKEWEI